MEMTFKPVLPDTARGREPGSSLRAPVEQVSPAPWRWFGAALSSFIDVVEPAVLRLSTRKRIVAVESPDGQDMEVFRVSRRRATSLGSNAENPDVLLKNLRRSKVRGVELRLDPERVATSRFKIPAPGAQFARQIIEGRLDRLTPWKADSIVHGFALSHKPGPDGQLDVDFAATSQAIVAASIARLAQLGLNPTAVGPAGQAVTERLRIDFFAGSKDTARRARRRAIGFVTMGAFFCSVLLSGSTFYLATESSTQIAALDVRLTKARNRLVQASGSTAERGRDSAYIATKRPDEARFFLIDRLADLIPDTAYLDGLDIEPGSIRIAGSSTATSDLIKIIEDDPAFHDARFVAPVTRQDDGRDRFEIAVSYLIKAKEPVP